MNRPPFDDLELRREMLRRLNEVAGITLSEDSISRRPSIQLSLLGQNAPMREGLEQVLDWFCERAGEGPNATDTA